jgi:hypothetical protein
MSDTSQASAPVIRSKYTFRITNDGSAQPFQPLSKMDDQFYNLAVIKFEDNGTTKDTAETQQVLNCIEGARRNPNGTGAGRDPHSWHHFSSCWPRLRRIAALWNPLNSFPVLLAGYI